MRIVVSTPTGKTGSSVVERLLDTGHELVLFARFPDKLAGAAARGATIVQGDLNDADTLARALDGADALFWLTPPGYEAPNVLDSYERFGDAAAVAIKKAGVPRVVHASSVGAHLDSPPGPIAGNRAVEAALDTTDAAIVHLRPGIFMDNALWALPTVREHGAIFIPVRGTVATGRIATRDIAEVAARWLQDATFTGRHTQELLGPADITYDAAAVAIGEAIGKPVAHVPVTPDEAREALKAIGTSPDGADRVVELYQALDAGALTPEHPRAPEATTPTTIAAFAADVFAPAYIAMG